MGSTVESIISILKLLFGLFVYFGLPALVFFVTFAVTVILVTRIGSSLLTVVVTRLPTVARPLNSLTRKFTNSSRDGDFELTRIGVVGGLAVVYAVIYILGAWGVFAVFDEIGEALFATPPEWYLPVTEYSYPIVALLVALPLILVLHTRRDSWRDGASVARTALEWALVLFTLNVLVPIGLYASVFGAARVATWFMQALWWLVEVISHVLL